MPTPSDEGRGLRSPSAAIRPVATERVASTDGVTLALHDLGGTGPTVLFCHPTGFLGMTWAPVAAALADRMHCWALDFRGHGDSTLPASESLPWRGMGDDVLAVVDHLGREPIYGVGHSMGGAALLLAEQAQPGTWAALWCYEPIVFPRFDGGVPPSNPIAEAARRRRAVFPDREAARLNYASKPPLASLHPAALEAYVTYGFSDRSDGDIELKCAPETEARTFEGSMSADTFGGLGSVACPVTIVASGDAAPPAAVAPLVAEALPQGRFERLGQLSHFGPMEDPAAIAAAIATSLDP